MIAEAVKMLKGEVKFSKNEDDDFEEVEFEDLGFQVVYAKLAATGNGLIDYAPSIIDVKGYFLEQITQLAAQDPKVNCQPWLCILFPLTRIVI
jgi:hypothetical protein